MINAKKKNIKMRFHFLKTTINYPKIKDLQEK